MNLMDYFNKVTRNWRRDVAHESQQWHLQCKTCGYQQSLAALGGMRWRAASVNKQTVVFCPNCKSNQWATYVHLPSQADGATSTKAE